MRIASDSQKRDLAALITAGILGGKHRPTDPKEAAKQAIEAVDYIFANYLRP